jgi:hypothetical protein
MLVIVFGAQLFFIALLKPYNGNKSNIRPTINMIITIIIESLFTVIKFTNDSRSIVALYAPIAILVLLFAAFVYSVVLIISDLK